MELYSGPMKQRTGLHRQGRHLAGGRLERSVHPQGLMIVFFPL